MSLPVGVKVTPLTTHRDDRGTFTELFRRSWMPEVGLIQWNGVNSEARVLRGVHVHIKHDDLLTVLRGRGIFGLRDIRRGSPTEGMTAMVELSAAEHRTLFIPHGVAHGFYFPEPSLHVYAVSEYFDMADELGCRFDDPDLGLDWPDREPKISARDRGLPTLKSIVPRVPAYGA